MREKSPMLLAFLCGFALCGTSELLAQTDGSARLEVTLQDYNGSSTRHWTVVWVTTSSGTFIKTLWKQGPSITASHWNSHCSTWYAAKAGSTAIDGYSGATASNYSGTNSPVILTWNGRDASNAIVPDGAYKFWVQYAEDSGQGPYTTGGLQWNKGPTGATNTYPAQGANFSGMRVAWTPSTPATIAPTITSATPPGTGTVGTPYTHTCTATGTAPINFTATGLPTGLSISPAGAISGTPSAAGTFSGTITAANGTAPNATQAFSIVIASANLNITSVQAQNGRLVMSGSGPANGTYHVLSSAILGLPPAEWPVISTNSFDASGGFALTNTVDAGALQKFYLIRLP